MHVIDSASSRASSNGDDASGELDLKVQYVRIMGFRYSIGSQHHSILDTLAEGSLNRRLLVLLSNL